jgi:hypothetical protein
MADEVQEITAEQAIALVQAGWLADGLQDAEAIGIITDRAQNLAFMEWMMSDEGRAAAHKLREQKAEAAGE